MKLYSYCIDIKAERRRRMWRHVEDAALILGGIIAIIAIIITM